MPSQKRKGNFKKILIISKMTELELNEFKYGAAVDDYYKRNNINIESLEENHDYHYQSLDRIVECFEQHGIKPGMIQKQSMGRRDFKERWDLIIPVGGDGTFMDVARYVLDSTLILGIKSSPNSIGGHYHTNFSNAEEHIKRLLAGEFSVENRARVEGVIETGSTITDLALNEIFVGDKYSTGYANLEVYYNGQIYKTGSSGILIASYMGRTGWYDQVNIIERNPEKTEAVRKAVRDAGLDDDIRIICSDADFKEGEENVIRYKIRESKDAGKSYGYEYGILKPGDNLKIVSRILVDGCVAFDGNKPNKPRHRVYDTYFGSVIHARISDKPLHVVNFN